MMNNIALACMPTVRAMAAKEIGGLQLLVADAPSTGTVGGINRASFAFWRNYSRDASDNSVTLSATTIQSEWNTVWAKPRAVLTVRT